MGFSMKKAVEAIGSINVEGPEAPPTVEICFKYLKFIAQNVSIVQSELLYMFSGKIYPDFIR